MSLLRRLGFAPRRARWKLVSIDGLDVYAHGTTLVLAAALCAMAVFDGYGVPALVVAAGLTGLRAGWVRPRPIALPVAALP